MTDPASAGTTRKAASRVERVGGPDHEGSAHLPHVLLAVDQLAKTLGGGERVLLRLARMLPAYGFRVSILTLALDPGSPALTAPLPCPVYLLPLTRTYDWNAWQAARALRRFLREQDVRLVQTFFESSDLWVGGVAKTIPGIGLIWSRRDLGILRQRKHRIAYRALSRMPDRVFAVSEQVRRHVIEVDGVSPERVRTVYNGIDVPEPPERRAASPVHITSVGNLRPVKGFDLLMEAAATVIASYPETRFTVAGEVLDPSYAEALRRRIEELGLTGKFGFLGGMPHVLQHLRQADIFVLPSRSEGLSNALLEAMAAGLPVVATDVGGNAECVSDGVSGLVVPPENVPELARALWALVSEGATRRAMGEAGRAIAESRFSNRGMLEITAEEYRRVLRRNEVAQREA